VRDGTKRLRPLVWVGRVLLGLACGAALGWMALAIYSDLAPVGPTWLRGGLAALVPVAALALWTYTYEGAARRFLVETRNGRKK
jgi:hypothetical protein